MVLMARHGDVCLNTFFQRHDRYLGVIVIVGLTLLLGGFELVVVGMRGPDFDDVHTPLGQLVATLASQPAVAPVRNQAAPGHLALIGRLYFGATLLQTLLFALLAWHRVQPNARRSGASNRLLLAAQLLLGLAGNSGLLLVCSVELALLLPLRRGLAWVLAQMLAYVAIRLLMEAGPAHLSGGRLRLALLFLAMEALLHIIVFGVVYLAARERRMRRTLSAAHAELLATQALLGDMVRDAERVRIARDLHDSVGHHLTALKLHLDIAVRQSGEPVPAALRSSSDMAVALLADVRRVVSVERRVQPIDLHRALATLCAGIPRPRIVLTMDDACVGASPAQAHALFCIAQEAISNAVRHANAATMKIDIARGEDGLTMHAADDGPGKVVVVEGNGLRGMRERVELLGGRMQAGWRQPRGYAIQVTLPNVGMTR
jgi:two-component system, NarL family, sensor histidine kinase DesK